VDEPGQERPLVSLVVRLEGDNRFLGVATALADHLAHHMGRPAAEGHRLGEAVDRAIAGVVEHAFEKDIHRPIDVEFLAWDALVEIYIRYQGSAGVLEQGLNRQDGGETALEVIRRNVDRVEFGEDAGVGFCKITRELPEIPGMR
jgi:hypothetical protein